MDTNQLNNVNESAPALEETQVSRRGFIAGTAAVLATVSFSASERAQADEIKKEKVDLQVGDQFPELKYDNVEGKAVDLLKAAEGKLAIVEFWGPWCRPCLAQVPHLKAAASELSGKSFVDPETGEKIGDDFVVLTVAANYDQTVPRWESMVKSGTFPGKLHTGTTDFEDIADKYGVQGYPSNFVIDGTGRIIMKGADVPSLPDLLKLRGFIKE